MEQKLYDAASRLPETGLDYHAIQPPPRSQHGIGTWRTFASLAACFLLLVSVGFITVEAKEYSDAIMFFQQYGLSADGLSRSEIKAVYRDITTESFAYSKTAEVIANSLSSDQIGGYEILQDHPTPEDIENLWNYKNYNGGFVLPNQQDGIHYAYRSAYTEDVQLNPEVQDKSFIEKYDGDTLLWSLSISEFVIEGYRVVSDGVIVYGDTRLWGEFQYPNTWIAKIDSDGELLWKHMRNKGFKDEYIVEFLENADGSYAVISRADFKHYCFSQYSADGKETYFKTIDVGDYGIWKAARFGDGYIVQLGNYMAGEFSRIVKMDRSGIITEAFSYSSEDAYYYITDMIEFDGSIYLSAYSVPRLEDEDRSYGGRNEIAAVLDYLFSNGIWEISSEELTPMVRDNYTAILLVCDPTAGTPQEFYSVKGSLGGKLSLSDSGMLLWDVESITTTFFSPATSSFTIGGTSYVFRYTFDPAGRLVRQEKTGEIVNYRR